MQVGFAVYDNVDGTRCSSSLGAPSSTRLFDGAFWTSIEPFEDELRRLVSNLQSG